MNFKFIKKLTKIMENKNGKTSLTTNKNLNNSYDEEVSELERKELEKLGSYLDEDEGTETISRNCNTKKNPTKNISIFKSTDFNDFPNENKQSSNNKLISKINITNSKNNEALKIIPENNNINLEYDENISLNNNNILKDDDIDNEIDLEYQLKKEYENDSEENDNKINQEDISDNELLTMPKENIIQYKNYQILKLKTLVKNLRHEKESLIENYKKTTDNLLKHIKELEFKGTGERPMTAKIIHKIATGSVSDISKTSDQENCNEKCPNCGLIIKSNFMEHSLECMRKKYKCVYCNLLLNIEEKNKHNELFYDKEKLFQAINKKNTEYVIKVLRHNFPINNIIIDEKTGDYFIHLIIKNDIFSVVKECDNIVNVNLENKQKETPLFIAINKRDISIVKELLRRGADLKHRNKGDLSPLMLCCKNNYQNIAELLIKKGAVVNEKNILGETPVKIAQINGNEELALKLIKQYKAEIS